MTQPGAAGGYETAVGGAEDGDAFLKHRNTVCLGMENNGGNGGGREGDDRKATSCNGSTLTIRYSCSSSKQFAFSSVCKILSESSLIVDKRWSIRIKSQQTTCDAWSATIGMHVQNKSAYSTMNNLISSTGTLRI